MRITIRPNLFGRSFGRKLGVLYDDYVKDVFVSACAINKREDDIVLHTQEVAGSSPAAPTIEIKRLPCSGSGRNRCHKGGVSGQTFSLAAFALLRNARSNFSTVRRTLSGTAGMYMVAVVVAIAVRVCSWMSRSVPPLSCASVPNPRRNICRVTWKPSVSATGLRTRLSQFSDEIGINAWPRFLADGNTQSVGDGSAAAFCCAISSAYSALGNATGFALAFVLGGPISP